MKSNFHTHTLYCDGKDSPEALVIAAIEKGFYALGFAGHSFNEPDADFAMSKDEAAEYRKVIAELKQRYKEKITIYCGIEQDYFSKEPTDVYDYVIGSVHNVRKCGEFITVDESAEVTKNAVEHLYGGCFDALAEDYFALVSDVAEKTSADIIGHFDLVSKFSEQLGYGESERYLAAAEKAIIKLVKFEKPFEINTGAMARGFKNVPYPSENILNLIKKHGGKIMISSDCHDKNMLDFAFDEVESLAKKAGYTEKAEITENGIEYFNF